MSMERNKRRSSTVHPMQRASPRNDTLSWTEPPLPSYTFLGLTARLYQISKFQQILQFNKFGTNHNRFHSIFSLVSVSIFQSNRKHHIQEVLPAVHRNQNSRRDSSIQLNLDAVDGCITECLHEVPVIKANFQILSVAF